MIRVTSIEQNFKMLLSDRIDFIPYSRYVGILSARKMGVEEKIEILSNPIFTGWFYIAFSKKSPLTKYIPEVNSGIKSAIDNGSIEVLIQKHLNRYAKMISKQQ